MANYVLYTDGACRGNPGPGGWGFLAQDAEGRVLFEGSGFAPETTNNVMELSAGLFGMKKLSQWAQDQGIGPVGLQIYSDSKYFVLGMSEWIHGWKRRGWKRSRPKAPPENLELWKSLDKAQGEFQEVTYHWVKGHSGHPQNDRCDELANLAISSHLG